MRKLPVFFVIDVSESMAGPAHEAVSAGIADIVSTLRTDPQALEMAQLSIIVFAGRAKVLVPMMELLHFYPPDLPIGGGTGLGAALDLLMTEIDKNVVTKSSDGRKGDWKPIVFLMTDGHPTDDPEKSIKRWEEHYARRVNLVAVSVGGSANHKMLQRLTENVVVLTDASATTFKRFLVWISQSIAAESRAAGDGHAGGPVNLSKTLPRGASVLDDLMPEVNIDDRLAVFIGRCQHTEAPYLMRFERAGGPREDRSTARYTLRQTMALRSSYFDLSDVSEGLAGTIKASQLAGMPACPHCGSRFGLVTCSCCGRIHCIDGPGVAICPWCGAENNYMPAEEGTDLDFGRSAG